MGVLSIAIRRIGFMVTSCATPEHTSQRLTFGRPPKSLDARIVSWLPSRNNVTVQGGGALG